MPLQEYSTTHLSIFLIVDILVGSSFHMCESFSRGYSQKWAFSILGYEYLQLYSILPNLAKFYQKFSKVVFHFPLNIKIFPDENILFIF